MNQDSFAFKTWRKAKTMFEVWIAHMSAYRAEIVIWMVAGAVPLIMMAIWIGKAQGAGGEVGGFSAAQFSAYFLAAWFSSQLIVAWVAWELDFQIRQGTFSTKLLKPINPIWEFLVQHLTERFVRGPFLLLILGAGMILVPGTKLVKSWESLGAFVLMITIAFLIRFFISYCIGMLCFWMESATSLDELYYVLAMIFSGTFAPLELYPAWLRPWVDLTPFPYIVYYPARILTGDIVGAQAWHVLWIQLIWLAVFGVLSQVLWIAGRKRYGSVGA